MTVSIDTNIMILRVHELRKQLDFGSAIWKVHDFTVASQAIEFPMYDNLFSTRIISVTWLLNDLSTYCKQLWATDISLV